VTPPPPLLGPRPLLASALSGHPGLRKLAVCCDAVSGAGLMALGGLHRLEDLTLTEGAAVSGELLASTLRRLPALSSLQVGARRGRVGRLWDLGRWDDGTWGVSARGHPRGSAECCWGGLLRHASRVGDASRARAVCCSCCGS
jgi:hypothetical protein